MRICRREFGVWMLGGLATRLSAVPPRPKLLVLIVLEQFRPDYIDSGWRQFGPGGLRRLVQNGAYFPDCRHLASTFSASALATLATGAWPAEHGIVADVWYDRVARKPVSASDDALLATTMGAQVAAAPRTRVFVAGMSAAHAALFAGTPEARRYWMDERGRFAANGVQPEWLLAFNSRRSPESSRTAHWTALGARESAPALRTLNYDPERPQEFLALYKASPFGQAAQFDLLGELIDKERLGQGGTFDFVCLLGGAEELLGYETGARSPLMEQMALHLDRRLESLLNQLNRAVGEDGFDLVLAAAHGAPPAPRQELRVHLAVPGEAVAQTVEHSLSIGGNGHVEQYLYPFLYLDHGGREPEPNRLAAARAALLNPAVAGYLTAGGACSTRDGWDQRFRNSFHLRRSGDVMLSYKPEYVEDFGQGRGVSYGSLYNYDVRVPLCFYGPQFRPGVFESPVESVDVAPTLARAMGIAAPSSSMGRVLGEAFVSTDDTLR